MPNDEVRISRRTVLIFLGYLCAVILLVGITYLILRGLVGLETARNVTGTAVPTAAATAETGTPTPYLATLPPSPAGAAP